MSNFEYIIEGEYTPLFEEQTQSLIDIVAKGISPFTFHKYIDKEVDGKKIRNIILTSLVNILKDIPKSFEGSKFTIQAFHKTYLTTGKNYYPIQENNQKFSYFQYIIRAELCSEIEEKFEKIINTINTDYSSGLLVQEYYEDEYKRKKNKIIVLSSLINKTEDVNKIFSYYPVNIEVSYKVSLI